MAISSGDIFWAESCGLSFCPFVGQVGEWSDIDFDSTTVCRMTGEHLEIETQAKGTAKVDFLGVDPLAAHRNIANHRGEGIRADSYDDSLALSWDLNLQVIVSASISPGFS